MKKTLTILLLSFIALGASAQDEKDPTAREKIKAAHAAYITERLELTSAEAEKFWPIYREYTQQRVALRQQYKQDKRNELDEKKLLDLDMTIKQQELDLERQYSDKLIKVIPAQKLMALRDAEHDFKKLLLRQVEQRQLKRGRMQRLRN